MPRTEYRPKFRFDDAPTICRFLQDTESFVRIIIGPVGSGKTTGNCCEIMRIADMQQVYPGEQYKRSRFAIIRNTAPELKSTTLNTWKYWFREEACGPVKMSSPIQHHIKIRPRKGNPGLDCEVYFIALDKPKDIKKLLSLELTAAFVNEVSQIPPAIMDMLRRRVGRYPPAREIDGTLYEAQRPCIICDTNAFDEDHWLYALYEENPKGWNFFLQPPAVLEVQKVSNTKCECVETNPVYREQMFHVKHTTEAAHRLWVVNPEAENLKYLYRGYYENQIAGSALETIRRDLQAKFVFVQEGKPVVDNYHDETFAVDELPILTEQDLIGGMDIGGGTLSPAFILAQRHKRGNWLIHAEITPDVMGVIRFSREIKAALAEIAPRRELSIVYADPACETRDELYEVTIKDHMQAKGIPVLGAPTNDIRARIDAWRMVFERWIDNRPGILINKKRCPRLRKGLSGSWYFRRLAIAGHERYREVPEKNMYSHPCDAGGYLLLGGGEYVKQKYDREAGTFGPDPVVAEIEFDVFKT